MGGKGGGSETVTTRLDPQTQEFVQGQRDLGQRFQRQLMDGGHLFAGADSNQLRGLNQIAGLSPDLSQFMNVSSGLAGSFGQPFDPSSINTFLDPFEQSVISGQQGLFQHQRDAAQTSAQQQATRAGAFGGARSALLEGQAIGDVNRQEADQIARLRSGGFSQALNAAIGQHGQQQQLGLAGLQNLLSGTQFGANFGLQQGNALFAGGEALRQIRQQRMQEPLFRAQQVLGLGQQALGPFGQTQGAQAGGGNPLAGAFGGALTGLGVGGPVGGLIGGGLGLLGGLFG